LKELSTAPAAEFFLRPPKRRKVEKEWCLCCHCLLPFLNYGGMCVQYSLYHDMIGDNHVDLAVMESKFENMKYTDPADFSRDMRRMISNHVAVWDFETRSAPFRVGGVGEQGVRLRRRLSREALSWKG
jgi:hypothetical protein